MGWEKITYNREELYAQVWSEPMIKLAPKYGLSDNGLRKICKKLNIPLPPTRTLGKAAIRQSGSSHTFTIFERKMNIPWSAGLNLRYRSWMK